MLFRSGSPGRTQEFQRFNPAQENILNQLLQQSMGQLQDQDYSFDPIEQQARTGFSEQTIPTLAERFTAMGSGSQGSSAFKGSLGQAGAGLEQSLASLRSKYNLADRGNLNQMLSMGLSPRFESAYRPSSPGMMQTGAESAMKMLPYLLMM